MNIKKLFEKTSTGFKEFVAKVEFANVIGLVEELSNYLKIDSNRYVSSINPDIEYDDPELPKINVVYGDGRTDDILLDLANEEFPGLMSPKDKVKLNTLEDKINSNHISLIDTDNNKYSLDLSYDGIVLISNSNKYYFQNDNCSIEANDIIFNGEVILKNKEIIAEKGLHIVSGEDLITRLNVDTTGTTIEEVLKVNSRGVTINTYQDDDVTIATNNIKINRGDRDVTLTADELIFNNTSTDTNDNSYYITTIGNGSISYKYKTNTAVDSNDNIKEQNLTFKFPNKSGTIELVDEERDAKLNQIIKSASDNIGYQYSSSFKSLEELMDYVKNNPTTEQYVGFIHNETTANVLLAKNGSVKFSMMNDVTGFVSAVGTLDFNTGDVSTSKYVCLETDSAILPNDIKILDYDNDKAYSLNIAKCLELGILSEVSLSNENSKSSKAKKFSLLNLKQYE